MINLAIIKLGGSTAIPDIDSNNSSTLTSEFDHYLDL